MQPTEFHAMRKNAVSLTRSTSLNSAFNLTVASRSKRPDRTGNFALAWAGAFPAVVLSGNLTGLAVASPPCARAPSQAN